MKKIFGLMLLLALSLYGCGYEQIDAGHRGVKVVWGEVSMKDGSIPEGLYFYNPISTTIDTCSVYSHLRPESYRRLI